MQMLCNVIKCYEMFIRFFNTFKFKENFYVEYSTNESAQSSIEWRLKIVTYSSNPSLISVAVKGLLNNPRM